jgi:hypothetical protein
LRAGIYNFSNLLRAATERTDVSAMTVMAAVVPTVVPAVMESLMEPTMLEAMMTETVVAIVTTKSVAKSAVVSTVSKMKPVLKAGVPVGMMGGSRIAGTQCANDGRDQSEASHDAVTS